MAECSDATSPHPCMMSNADPQELATFAQHAHAWWNPDGPFKTLHVLNPLRLRYIQRHARLHERRVLDLGCGGGILSEALAKQGAHVTAIDLEPATIACAEAHADGLNINYRVIDAEAFAAEHPGEFDVVTCMELLEHVPDPAKLVQTAARFLKPGGHLFFSTINRTPQAFFGAIVAAEYLLKLLPRGTHRYDYFIKPKELARYCRDANLEVLDLTGIHYQPWTHTARLCRNLMNYIGVAEAKA